MTGAPGIARNGRTARRDGDVRDTCPCHAQRARHMLGWSRADGRRVGTTSFEQGLGETRRRIGFARGLLTAAPVSREPLLLVLDAVAVSLAYGFALFLHFEGAIPVAARHAFWRFLPLAITIHLTWHAVRGLYGKVWREAGVLEARATLSAVLGAVTTILLLVAVVPMSTLGPGVVLTGGALALLSVGAIRFRDRLLQERTCPTSEAATRVILMGSTDVARPVIQQMRSDPDHDLLPVAVVNGDPVHWGRSVAGVPVYGPPSSLPWVAREHDADQVLLAMATDDPRQVRRAVDIAREAQLPVRILPRVHDVLVSRPVLRDIRDLSIDDLLGRRQVETDMVAIRALLTGRRVLITGGGGSIGAEIARQVSTFGPSRLVLLDHDETHLHDAMAGIPGEAIEVLGDVRDRSFIDQVLAAEQPEVIFHAAALKHVPILERYPVQAIATNVIGTDNVLEAATAHGVERVVLISTDKAVNPSSVMGATKRLGEQLLVHRRPDGGRYCAVRFGNVLGSRGSVIPTFLRQIEQGGPVTVTHPMMTRYFMSIREAVTLVLQAAVLTHGGEIFMLDMGEPVRIVDLAERLIFLSGGAPGRDIAIEFTGIRPGEKLHEEIVSTLEIEEPTSHPHIRLVRSPMLPADLLHRELERLRAFTAANEDDAARTLLQSLAATQVTVEVGA
jgi:FlaA1/EpsC-like NDP-sugar epimerase